MRRVFRALAYEIDTRGVEVITAGLSLWFVFALLTSDAAYRPVPAGLWAAWCGTAAVLKLAGFGASTDPCPPRWARWARLAGSVLGTFFWLLLAGVLFLLLRHGISWGGYAIVAAGQGWCAARIWRDR